MRIIGLSIHLLTLNFEIPLSHVFVIAMLKSCKLGVRNVDIK